MDNNNAQSGYSVTGLSASDVEARISAGKVNTIPDDNSQTVSGIIKKNVFTYFNLIFLIIAILLVIAGFFNFELFKSLSFLPVVIANTLIGIIQQLRSKRVLDKLSLLAKTNYDVIRDSQPQSVIADDLVLDDLIVLGEGQQIPADAVVISGRLSVNESLLTGEADEIEKTEGSELKSGSFVVNGTCRARLTHVGSDSYAAQLTMKAKELKDKQSEMIRSIELIIKVAGIAIIPIGIALFIEAIIAGAGFAGGVDSAVGAVIGMIPEGLYLLVTIALALSAMRLARNKILLHDMRSIETLARVDVLCVDKTGTITNNEMSVTEVFAPSGVEGTALKSYEELLGRYIYTVTDSNITMQAMRNYYPQLSSLPATEIIPFTSKLKYSQITAENTVYRFGAPDILLPEPQFEANRELIDARADKGDRVLAFVAVTAQGVFPLVFVALKNGIRDNAPETFEYFRKQGVEIKVISGDNPLTVSRIATQVGIENADKYIDATTLVTDEAIRQAVGEYTVFGRVKPEQKKQIVEAIKANRKKVAMTGDGVNDILAMKEADCSIAMGTGSDAARHAAQVVLLDSDFSKMMDIVSQGRQIINNITRSATLFLYKNMFSMLLAAFSIITAFSYPLNSSQVSLVSGFNIGVPAFLLSLEPNFVKQDQHFLKKTLLTAMPASLTSFFSIAAMVVFANVFHISDSDVGVASTYLLAIVGFLILRNITKPSNTYRNVVLFGCIAGFLVCVIVPQLRWLYRLDAIQPEGIMLCVVFAFAEASVMRYLVFLFEKAPDFIAGFKSGVRQSRKKSK